MKPTSAFNAWLARIAAALVSAGAIFGSSLHLYAMSVNGQQVAPWAQPLSLDAVALVAGAVRRCRRDDRLALASLVVTVVLSTALQVSDSWAHTGNVTDALLAALPPLGGWLVFELFLRATETEPTVITSTPRRPRPPKPQPPAQPDEVKPDEVKPTPLRPPRPDAKPVRPAARTMDELMTEATALAQERGVEPTELSQRTLQAELKIGGNRAGALAQALQAGRPSTGYHVPVPEPMLVSSNGNGAS